MSTCSMRGFLICSESAIKPGKLLRRQQEFKELFTDCQPRMFMHMMYLHR